MKRTFDIWNRAGWTRAFKCITFDYLARDIDIDLRIKKRVGVRIFSGASVLLSLALLVTV